MKTLCLSLGMLLLIACCCNAMPQAQQYNTGPVCCNKFSSFVIPKKYVSEIKKTHSFCMRKGLVVKTVKGRSICFRESEPWVLKAYNQMQNPEGSSQQQ